MLYDLTEGEIAHIDTYRKLTPPFQEDLDREMELALQLQEGLIRSKEISDLSTIFSLPEAP